MDRNEKILHRINPEMKVLEIGPSFAPILPKAGRSNIFSLDHASQADLQAKYGPLGVDISKIEPVDFVWSGGLIHDCIPQELHGTFDAIVVSHVFEHSPDPISFLNSSAILLKTGGYLSLANPDKRFTFDFLKPLTTVADMIEAFQNKADRHTSKTAFYQDFYSVRNNGDLVWATWLPTGKLEYIDPNLRLGGGATEISGDYVDAHAWYFTPSSFELIVLELNILGLSPFKVDAAFPSWGCEFYCTLVKSEPVERDLSVVQRERMGLYRRSLEELQEQLNAWPYEYVNADVPI